MPDLGAGVRVVLLTHMVAYFSPPFPRLSSCVQKWRLGRGQEPQSLPALRPLPPQKTEGGEQRRGSDGRGSWSMLKMAALVCWGSWEGQGLFLFLPLSLSIAFLCPATSGCSLMVSGSLLALPLAQLLAPSLPLTAILWVPEGSQPLMELGSIFLFLWILMGKLCQTPEPLSPASFVRIQNKPNTPPWPNPTMSMIPTELLLLPKWKNIYITKYVTSHPPNTHTSLQPYFSP